MGPPRYVRCAPGWYTGNEKDPGTHAFNWYVADHIPVPKNHPTLVKAGMRPGSCPEQAQYDHGHAIDRVVPMLLMVVSWVWGATDRLRTQSQRVAHGLTTTVERLYEKNECVCLWHHR